MKLIASFSASSALSAVNDCHLEWERIPFPMFPPTKPRTCIIVLNWNGLQDTLECLESLMALETQPDTIVICDNGSTDGSPEAFLDWMGQQYDSASIEQIETSIYAAPTDSSRPSFVLVENHSNLGYAGGNNVGVRFALSQNDYDFIWILSNDTIVHPCSLTAQLDYARKHPQIHILGSTVVYYGDGNRVQCAGGCTYNPLTTVFRFVYNGETLQSVLEKPAPRLDYIYGTSLFVRTEVFEESGLFCEQYSHFYEDIDFCKRAQKSEFKIEWCRQSIIFHKGRYSKAQLNREDKMSTALSNYHENLSTLIYTKRHYPILLPGAMLFRFFGKLFMVMYRGQSFLIRPLVEAYRDFVKQIFGK